MIDEEKERNHVTFTRRPEELSGPSAFIFDHGDLFIEMARENATRIHSTERAFMTGDLLNSSQKPHPLLEIHRLNFHDSGVVNP